MALRDLLFGKALASQDEGGERVGWLAGVPMLGLDALSSAAYGPEAAMTLLIPLGVLGIGYVLVVAVGISAGVGALVSAVPPLQPYTLTLCLAILVLIATVNL